MTLTSLATCCACDARSSPAPEHGCVLWILHGETLARITFDPPSGHTVPLSQWIDILVDTVRTAYSQARLRIAAQPSLLPDRFQPMIVTSPLAPSGVALLLPTRSGRIIEAAFGSGDAIELPWFRDPTNDGIGARALPRQWSLAAALLDIAKETTQARLN